MSSIWRNCGCIKHLENVWSICAFPITVYLFVFMIHGVINVLIIIIKGKCAWLDLSNALITSVSSVTLLDKNCCAFSCDCRKFLHLYISVAKCGRRSRTTASPPTKYMSSVLLCWCLFAPKRDAYTRSPAACTTPCAETTCAGSWHAPSFFASLGSCPNFIQVYK